MKRLIYGSVPGFYGRFPYFGKTVHFPKGSIAFLAACDQGIFEADNVRLLQSLARSGSCCLDIGANLGLMALPLLHAVPGARVVSFEPSPNALPWLRRTVEDSGYGSRWTLIDKAVGAVSGRVSFSVSSPEHGLFDGIRNTGRVPEIRSVEVEQTTIDEIWISLGKPQVSVIKSDVEGGDLDVLRGARRCLEECRPSVLIEWNAKNLLAYGLSTHDLLVHCRALGYRLHAVPGLVPISERTELELHMVFTESFLLRPADAS